MAVSNSLAWCVECARLRLRPDSEPRDGTALVTGDSHLNNVPSGKQGMGEGCFIQFFQIDCQGCVFEDAGAAWRFAGVEARRSEKMAVACNIVLSMFYTAPLDAGRVC